MAKAKKRRQYGTGGVYQQASDGRWRGTIEAGYNRNGTRRRITVTAKTEAEAKRRLERRRLELNRDPGSTSTRTTVKSWAEQWLAMTERTVRPKTHTTDLGAVTAWIIPTIGHKRLDQLTPADVRAVDTAVTAAGRSTSTAKRYHAVLERMLKAAVQEGHQVPPRVIAVKAPLPAPNDRQAIAIADALAMLEVASWLPHGTRWVAAFLQGMRQGECLGLRWDHVGPDALTVSWQLQSLPYVDPRDRSKGFRIPDGYEVRQLDRSLHLVRPKSRAGWRVVPIIPVLSAGLERWREVCPPSPHGLVWPALDGAPASARQDRVEWQAIQDTAGVHHPAGRFYTGHEARHATATLLMSLGVPETVRVSIMGHSSIASTRAYEHADLAGSRAALEMMGQRLQLG